MENIAVIGIGKLGLCLALNLERAGYNVLGIDVKENYTNALNNKSYKTIEPQVNDYLASSKNFRATTDYSEIFTGNYRLIFIVVPTPSLPSGEFNHRYIDEIISVLEKWGHQPNLQHIVINSTCMPGYCNSIQKKLNALNYSLSYNPEFIAQGSIIKDQLYPDQVLIGEANEEAGNIIQSVYKKMCKNEPEYCRMTALSAEITKLATNCFLTTKIAFANAVGDIAADAGAEPDKILQAIGSDSRIGNKYFKYGFGYGGPCFPRDNKAFLAFTEKMKYKMFIAESTDKANQLHNDFLVHKWTKEFSKEEEIVFDYVTYKKDTDMLEESQQLKLALTLAKEGYKVVIHEKPEVIEQLTKQYTNLFIYRVNEN